MNSNEMQHVWNSPLNNLPPGEQKQMAEQFIRQMNRCRRFQRFWLIHTFTWLAIITVAAIWSVALGKTKLAHEWALLPLLIVPWAFAIYFLRSYLKMAAPKRQKELSVVESLRAALASNLNRQSRLKMVGGLYLILVPVLVLALRQLHTVGKVSERELVSMAVFFGGALGISALFMAALFVRSLLPQQKRLEGLLAEIPV